MQKDFPLCRIFVDLPDVDRPAVFFTVCRMHGRFGNYVLFATFERRRG